MILTLPCDIAHAYASACSLQRAGLRSVAAIGSATRRFHGPDTRSRQARRFPHRPPPRALAP
eukprot:scaffold206276_cov33-Tisochrysis_lutea.AAC.2